MIPNLVTELVAAYGALVATVVLVVQIKSLRPHIIVTVERVWFSDSDGRFTDEQISVKAANIGQQIVYFEGLPALFHGKTGMCMQSQHSDDDTFPLDLKPGASCKVHMNPVLVAESLRKSGAHGVVDLRARYIDETKRVYWGHRFRFDIDNPLQTTN